MAKGKGCRKTWPGRVMVAGGPASFGAPTSGVPLNKPGRPKPDSGDLGCWFRSLILPKITWDLIGVPRRDSVPTLVCQGLWAAQPGESE